MVLLLIVGLLAAGGIIYFIVAGGAKTPSVANPTYDKDIRPVLQSKCTGCHNPNGVRPDSPLDAGQRDLIKKWIDQGAKEK